MNFSSAFKYPFRNFAKVMSIVLALTIAFAVMIAMILNSYDWTAVVAHLYEIEAVDASVNTFEPLSGTTIIGIFGLVVVAIASGFWLSGYSIEVIRAVMREDEWMPAVNFGQNVKDGALLFVSSVAYWLLLIALMALFIIVNRAVASIALLSGVVVLVSAVLIVVVPFIMGWGYFVGMGRFAADGDYKSSWQIWRNMRIAKANKRIGFTLLCRMIALWIIYVIVNGIADGVFGGLMGDNLLAGITLSIIIYYTFNLMQHFSAQVLIAQYAKEIGIRGDHYDPEKGKVDAF